MNTAYPPGSVPTEGDPFSTLLLVDPGMDPAFFKIAPILRELVVTERNYVNHLELVQVYMRALVDRGAIDQDTVHRLFPGLNELVDLQRNFLLDCEEQYMLPWEEQRWGLCFTANEASFAVYEPFFVNYESVRELARVEEPRLKAASDIMHFRDVPVAMGRPVSRLCRYPLFFDHLLRLFPRDHAFYRELEEGSAACRRIIEKCNETRRRVQNAATVKLLEQRVEDWKGLDLANFGELLHSDTFEVKRSDVHRNHQVFLFERIIIFCREVVNVSGWIWKGGKNDSILRKTYSQVSPNPPATNSEKEIRPLRLKGRIHLNTVTHTACETKGGQFALQIFWRGEESLKEVELICRHEVHMKMWEASIVKCVRDVQGSEGGFH